MNKIENYLGIANHDIQIANNSDELKSYVASLLCEIDELQQENKQLKDNWNKLKEYIRNFPAIEYFSVEKVDGIRLSGKLLNEDYLLNKMQEIEQGSDSNE